MNRPIEFRGRITEEDFVRAQRLHRNRALVLGVRLLLVVGLVVLVLHSLQTGGWTALLLNGPLVLLVVSLNAFERWSWRRTYRRQPSLHEEVAGSLGEEGLEYSAPFFQGTLPWRVLVRAKVEPQIILVYQGPKLLNLLPRGLFASQQDWERAVELVRRKLPQAGKAGG